MGDKAYVICCNDHVEAVVLNDEEKAEREMKRLKKKYYNLNFSSITFKDYCLHVYWHIRKVKVL